jgi:hypothetical protein
MTKDNAGRLDIKEAAELRLVELLRRQRGRLTRRELVAVAGLDPEIRYHRQKITKLIRKWQIAVASVPTHALPSTGCERDEDDQRLARDNLRFEIAAAKSESRTSPPYRPGTLEW